MDKIIINTLNELVNYKNEHKNFEGAVIINAPISNLPKDCFFSCKLNKIVINSKILSIKDSCFYACSNLKNVELPETIKEMGRSVFSLCTSLEEIVLPHELNILSESIFRDCCKLNKIYLPESLMKISAGSFSGCTSLKKLTIPKNVSTIPYNSIICCNELKYLEFKSNKIVLKKGAICECPKLNTIKFNGVENIEEESIVMCYNAEQIEFNNETLNCEKTAMFDTRPKYINFKNHLLEAKGNNYIYPIVESGHLYFNENSDADKIINYKALNKNGKVMSISSEEMNLLINKNLAKEYDKINIKNKLLFWKGNKFMPCGSIIEGFPVDYVELFYKNKNCIRWKQVSDGRDLNFQNKLGLFKISYALGLFDESEKVSREACEFINKNFNKNAKINFYKLFGNYSIKNRYNSKFKKFFMMHFSNDENFLYFRRGLNNFMEFIHNDWDEISKAFSHKIINTNKLNDKLTLDNVKGYFIKPKYLYVKKDNEKLATLVGLHNYSQTEFEELQILYDLAKEIDEKECKVQAYSDDANCIISYELLNKNNPLNLVLGDLTNCCQTINKSGKDCVRYGLLKNNSKFLVFKQNGKIICESWVWYDKKTETLCLDNIEASFNVQRKLKKEPEFNDGMVKCLQRFSTNAVLKMRKNGVNVKKVTCGLGFNEFERLLKDEFLIADESVKLYDYNGYSDAEQQVVIGVVAKAVAAVQPKPKKIKQIDNLFVDSRII